MFTLSGYHGLLSELKAANGNFRSIQHIDEPSPGDVFLRHDIDFSVELALPMARVESQLGVPACYYVLLSAPANPCTSNSIAAMQELRSLGHEIGLHYDLSSYPSDPDRALARLEREAAFLSDLSGGEVNSIVMHEPFRGHQDLFEQTSRWVNPTRAQKNDTTMMYVSDSCRAWRDKSILDYLSGASAKNKLLLNTHPESWLAIGGMHRLTYLESVLLPRVQEPSSRYFLETVKRLWTTHVGPTSGFGDSDA